jgi:hypothetical protein
MVPRQSPETAAVRFRRPCLLLAAYDADDAGLKVVRHLRHCVIARSGRWPFRVDWRLARARCESRSDSTLGSVIRAAGPIWVSNSPQVPRHCPFSATRAFSSGLRPRASCGSLKTRQRAAPERIPPRWQMTEMTQMTQMTQRSQSRALLSPRPLPVARCVQDGRRTVLVEGRLLRHVRHCVIARSGRWPFRVGWRFAARARH